MVSNLSLPSRSKDKSEGCRNYLKNRKLLLNLCVFLVKSAKVSLLQCQKTETICKKHMQPLVESWGQHC